MQEMQAELVLDARATLGEGPFWWAERGVLCWADISGFAVHLFDPHSGEDRKVDVGTYVGFAAPSVKGDLIVGLRNGFHRLDVESGELTFIGDPEADFPINRLNDGKAGPDGAIWAGTMAINGQNAPGCFYRLDINGDMHQLFDGVGISNGLTWSLDLSLLYYIDTPLHRVDVFDFDGLSGAISNRRTAFDVPLEWGNPDGMTIDSEGMLWIALWGGSGVIRVDPKTGERVMKVHVPAAHTTAMEFGGPNRETLYITTAREGRSEEQLADEPLSGGVFAANPGVQGLPAFKYEG